jgi:hypothetical protein
MLTGMMGMMNPTSSLGGSIPTGMPDMNALLAGMGGMGGSGPGGMGGMPDMNALLAMGSMGSMGSMGGMADAINGMMDGMMHGIPGNMGGMSADPFTETNTRDMLKFDMAKVGGMPDAIAQGGDLTGVLGWYADSVTRMMDGMLNYTNAGVSDADAVGGYQTMMIELNAQMSSQVANVMDMQHLRMDGWKDYANRSHTVFPRMAQCMCGGMMRSMLTTDKMMKQVALDPFSQSSIAVEVLPLMCAEDTCGDYLQSLLGVDLVGDALEDAVNCACRNTKIMKALSTAVPPFLGGTASAAIETALKANAVAFCNSRACKRTSLAAFRNADESLPAQACQRWGVPEPSGGKNVTFRATLAGALDDFDAVRKDQYKEKLGKYLKVAKDKITLTLQDGSVVATANTDMGSSSNAAEASMALQSLLDNLNMTSVIFNMTVLGLDVTDDTNSATFQDTFVAALLASQGPSATQERAGLSTPALIGIIVGVLAGLCCLGAIGFVACGKKGGAHKELRDANGRAPPTMNVHQAVGNRNQGKQDMQLATNQHMSNQV